ncbi:MAG: CobD/CbiB family protein [Burkholderiales bacterium]
MGFFSLAAALLAQYFRAHQTSNPIQDTFRQLAYFLERQFNAGKRHYGIMAWAAGIALVVIPVASVYTLVHGLGPSGKLIAFFVNAVVLYFALQFRSASLRLRAVQQALQRDDIDDARSVLGEYLDRNVALYSRDEISRVTIEQLLLSAHKDLFGPLIWFLVLPGPVGPLFYILARELNQTWSRNNAEAENGVDSEPDLPFGHFAQQMWDWIDWVPRRVTALSFGIAGDFQDAMECWRAQAQSWPDSSDGIVLTSGAGALEVRLGLPLTTTAGADYRPEIGTGEHAQADFVESAEGLVWRALALWLAVLVLVTLASAITLITATISH